MVAALLLRGMLVGIVAGLLCFGFLRIVGEPQVDRAIAFETQLDEARAQAAAQALIAKRLPAPNEEREPELVSRRVQAGIGLFIGVLLYNVAFGGLFALAFALAYGRIGDFGPRTTAALLAVMGLVAVYIVPNLKYPANPPSIGDPATIGMRTALYFSMIAISLAAMIAAGMLRLRLLARFGAWNAVLIAGAVYLLVVTVAGLAMPAVNEVPEQFPAVVLWQFRIASMGAQLIMWATIGLLFGAVSQRANERKGAGVGGLGAGPSPPRWIGRRRIG
jgi:predicted cobalt transporter CbtA